MVYSDSGMEICINVTKQLDSTLIFDQAKRTSMSNKLNNFLIWSFSTNINSLASSETKSCKLKKVVITSSLPLYIQEYVDINILYLIVNSSLNYRIQLQQIVGLEN